MADKIKFSVSKTREEIAQELGISKRTLTRKIQVHKLNIPKYQLLNVDQQISIYVNLLGEESLKNTQYAAYIS